MQPHPSRVRDHREYVSRKLEDGNVLVECKGSLVPMLCHLNRRLASEEFNPEDVSNDDAKDTPSPNGGYSSPTHHIFLIDKSRSDRLGLVFGSQGNVDFRLPGRKESYSVSRQCFRLWMNKDGIWMFSNLSSRECNVNGDVVCSTRCIHLANPWAGVEDLCRIVLRPDNVNLIRISEIELAVRVPESTRLFRTILDEGLLDGLGIQSQTTETSSSSQPSESSGAAHLPAPRLQFEYHELGKPLVPSNGVYAIKTLMHKRTGSKALGMIDTRVDIAITEREHDIQRANDVRRQICQDEKYFVRLLGLRVTPSGLAMITEYRNAELLDAYPAAEVDMSNLRLLFAQIGGGALQHLRNHRMVHHDIRRGTILVELQGSVFSAYLTGFSHAKQLEADDPKAKEEAVSDISALCKMVHDLQLEHEEVGDATQDPGGVGPSNSDKDASDGYPVVVEENKGRNGTGQRPARPSTSKRIKTTHTGEGLSSKPIINEDPLDHSPAATSAANMLSTIRRNESQSSAKTVGTRRNTKKSPQAPVPKPLQTDMASKAPSADRLIMRGKQKTVEDCPSPEEISLAFTRWVGGDRFSWPPFDYITLPKDYSFTCFRIEESYFVDLVQAMEALHELISQPVVPDSLSRHYRFEPTHEIHCVEMRIVAKLFHLNNLADLAETFLEALKEDGPADGQTFEIKHEGRVRVQYHNHSSMVNLTNISRFIGPSGRLELQESDRPAEIQDLRGFDAWDGIYVDTSWAVELLRKSNTEMYHGFRKLSHNGTHPFFNANFRRIQYEKFAVIAFPRLQPLFVLVRREDGFVNIETIRGNVPFHDTSSSHFVPRSTAVKECRGLQLNDLANCLEDLRIEGSRPDWKHRIYLNGTQKRGPSSATSVFTSSSFQHAELSFEDPLRFRFRRGKQKSSADWTLQALQEKEDVVFRIPTMAGSTTAMDQVASWLGLNAD
ncbi:MAG: hypothetical protein Q9171_005774 [Xanthocarpia ochracea]